MEYDMKKAVDIKESSPEVSETPKSEFLLGRDGRVQLIKEIEQVRDSKVVTYICGDRQGAPQAQIAGDVIRPIYEHLRGIGKQKKIDFFIHSKGGEIEVPWRMITMLREFCDHLSILIPYHSQSAATLLALGCDEIIMGEKAELGPIDPSINFGRTGGTTAQEEVAVEDMMAFIRFVKSVSPLSRFLYSNHSIACLTEKLSPWNIGKIYRTHTHIRMVAKRMLKKHKQPLSKLVMNKVVKTLAEKIYSHGHAICRVEAKEIGLPVVYANSKLDGFMWELFSLYEKTLKLREPLDINTELPDTQDEKILPLTIAIVESEKKCTVFNGKLKIKRYRQMPASINININATFGLPPNLSPEQVSPALQQSVQKAIDEIKQQAPKWVMEQAKSQSPVLKIEAQFRGAAWREI